MSFNRGDVVRLKSGGTSMTVNGYSSDDVQYQCIWNVGGVHQDEWYRPDILEKVSSSTPLNVPNYGAV